MKVIHPHLRDSRDAIERFSIEARAVAKLHHPNIVLFLVQHCDYCAHSKQHTAL